MVEVPYAALWAIYKESPAYREQIMKWLDLPKTLASLGWKGQAEILDNAPVEVIKAHAHLLDDRAIRKLGLVVTYEWARLV